MHTTHDGGLESEERERPSRGREEVKYGGGSDVKYHFPSVDSIELIQGPLFFPCFFPSLIFFFHTMLFSMLTIIFLT